MSWKHSLFLLILLTFSCKNVQHLANVETKQLHMTDETAPSDTAIVALIAPYKQQLDAVMNEVIAYSAEELHKAQPESGLGNLMADIIHEGAAQHYAQAIDFGVVNYGGIRLSTLPAGPITRGKVFELMPFDNKVVVLKVKGDVVQQLFDRMAVRGGWPISKSVQFTIHNDQPEDIIIGGAPLDLNRIYRIAISDFVANGGDRCFFFREQPRDQLNIVYRDMIMDYCSAKHAAGEKIGVKVTGRVKIRS